MISYLTWKIISLEYTRLTILTNSWVWYDVWINELIYSQLKENDEVDVFIYHHITDNNQSLFGFLTQEDKKVFEELIKISGVWGKVAQQILSMWVERLLNAIESEDNKTIEGTKWVWKKMAEKIILELKDKDFWIQITKGKGIKNKNTISWNLYSSIKFTLTNMWYNQRNIDQKLSNLPEELVEAGDIIPYIIKELS
jgi:holliday junction DNA helicase RuvA